MMTRQFLEQLDAAGIKVWADGDALRCNAPKGVLTPELHAELATRKPEILTFLRAGLISNSSIVPLQTKGSRPVFFGLPGHNGDVFCYVRLARYLGDDQPFYALQPPGFNGECPPCESVVDLAAHHVKELLASFPGQTYNLGGYCAGGTLAFEMAQQITRMGGRIGLLVLFECPFPASYSRWNQFAISWRRLFLRIPHHLQAMAQLDSKGKLAYVSGKLERAKAMRSEPGGNAPVTGEREQYRAEVAEATMRGVKAYVPLPYPGRITIFRASPEAVHLNENLQRNWQAYALGGCDVHVGPEGCPGSMMLREPFAEYFAQRLRNCIDEQSQGQPTSEVEPPSGDLLTRAASSSS